MPNIEITLTNGATLLVSITDLWVSIDGHVFYGLALVVHTHAVY